MTNHVSVNKLYYVRVTIWGLGLLLGLAALAACRPAPVSPTAFVPATQSAAPTATAENPVSTAATTPTPLPPTPEASPTPEAAATTAAPAMTAPPTESPTPDPNLGLGEVVYSDQFDGKSGWFWSYSDGVATFAASGGKLNAAMTIGNSYPRLTGGKPDLKVGDQQLRVTAHTNACGPKDEYGVMFRVNAGITDGYAFKIRCDGQARFELVRNYQPTVLVEWKAHPAIIAGAPADNALMVWMAKGQFHFYVNDKYIFSAQDQTFGEGTYGFVVNDRTAGGELVSFTDMTAKAVTQP